MTAGQGVSKPRTTSATAVRAVPLVRQVRCASANARARANRVSPIAVETASTSHRIRQAAVLAGELAPSAMFAKRAHVRAPLGYPNAPAIASTFRVATATAELRQALHRGSGLQERRVRMRRREFVLRRKVCEHAIHRHELRRLRYRLLATSALQYGCVSVSEVDHAHARIKIQERVVWPTTLWRRQVEFGWRTMAAFGSQRSCSLRQPKRFPGPLARGPTPPLPFASDHRACPARIGISKTPRFNC